MLTSLIIFYVMYYTLIYMIAEFQNYEIIILFWGSPFTMDPLVGAASHKKQKEKKQHLVDSTSPYLGASHSMIILLPYMYMNVLKYKIEFLTSMVG